MKKNSKILVGMSSCAMLLLLGASALAISPDDVAKINEYTAESAAYMYNTVKEPIVSSIGGEWAVIGLARSGYDVSQDYIDAYYKTVEEYVTELDGNLHDKKYTEYSRVSVALSSVGADATDVAGYNLLTALGDFDKTIWQGINGPIWALIALDTLDYGMPKNEAAEVQATRQMYVDEILSRQLTDGGWSLTGVAGESGTDPDITGMALQALANYTDQENVKIAVDEAVLALSNMQDDNGGFSSWGVDSSEAVAQVIVALCTLGIDPAEDERFVKHGNSLMDNFLTYRQDDGSFIHTQDGSGNSQMSSEQGLYGLDALQRFANGENSLYDMTDVAKMGNSNIETSGFGLVGKNPDVKKVPVSVSVEFSDTKGSKNLEAIDALASRAIINGQGDGTFAPENTMTRAEFATITVKALGLTPESNDAFDDVVESDWFAPYVGTANEYGLINGVGEGKFNPNGNITREEAAVLVARAAKLCGVDTSMDETSARDILAGFADYMTISDWAKKDVAFCYQENILDQMDLNVEPQTDILRGEIAQMIYNLLEIAKLL